METALIIIGEKGTGKQTFFTDILCKLLGIYANPEVDNMD
jgi:septin family protein